MSAKFAYKWTSKTIENRKSNLITFTFSGYCGCVEGSKIECDYALCGEIIYEVAFFHVTAYS